MLAARLEILPLAQRELWPHLVEIPEDFVLYGGTAIALRLGHRASIDFDFFSDQALDERRQDHLLATIGWLTGADILQRGADTLTVSLAVSGAPVKLSFFGGIANGRVGIPERTADGVACVASLDDLLAHKLKVVHDRAEGKDYQDIAALLAAGLPLARGLACRAALFGDGVPPMLTLKALAYFDDISEAWRLTPAMRERLESAIRSVPVSWPPAGVLSTSLRCA